MRPLTLLLVLVLLSLDHGRLAAAQAQAVHLDLKTEWLSQLEVLAAQIDRYKTISRFVSEDRAYHKQAMILASDKTPVDIVLRRTAALIADLEARGVDLSAAKQRLAELQAQAASAPAARIEEEQDLPKKSQYTPVTVSNADALMPLFSQACQLQREVSLKNPLLDFNDIVFVERNPVDYGHMCDEWYGRVSEPGGSLYILRDASSLFQDQTVPVAAAGGGGTPLCEGAFAYSVPYGECSGTQGSARETPRTHTKSVCPKNPPRTHARRFHGLAITGAVVTGPGSGASTM